MGHGRLMEHRMNMRDTVREDRPRSTETPLRSAGNRGAAEITGKKNKIKKKKKDFGGVPKFGAA